VAKVGFADRLGESAEDDGSFLDAEPFEEVVADEFDVLEEFAPTSPGSSFVFGGGFGDGFISCTL
jgi:hypothetical protein